MTPPLASWFGSWFVKHKRWNSGPGWNSFGSDEEDLFPWVNSFRRQQVTEGEAFDASLVMAEELSLYPEHHLPRLLTLIREARAERAASPPLAPWQVAADAEASRREEVSALVEAEWGRLDEVAREAWRFQVREASPGLARFRWPCVEALAKQAHAETIHPELRPTDQDGLPEFTLDSLRRVADRPDPKANVTFSTLPTAATLTPEQELTARQRAVESRLSQIERLRALERTRFAPPESHPAATDPRRPHAQAI